MATKTKEKVEVKPDNLRIGGDKGPISSLRIARSIASRATADIRSHVNYVHELLKIGLNLADPTDVPCYKANLLSLGTRHQLGFVFMDENTVKCGVFKRLSVEKGIVIYKSPVGTTETIEVDLGDYDTCCLFAVVNMDCLTTKEADILCSMFSATTRFPEDAVKILMQASYDVAYISPYVIRTLKETAKEFLESLSIKYALRILSKYSDKAEALKAAVSAPGSLFSGEQVIRSTLDDQVVKVMPKTLWLTVSAYDTDSVTRGLTVVYQDLNTNCIVTNIDDIRIDTKYPKNIELNRSIRSEYSVLRALSEVANFKGSVGRDSAVMPIAPVEGIHTTTNSGSVLDLTQKATMAYVDLKDALDKAKALVAALTNVETGYVLGGKEVAKIAADLNKASKPKETGLSGKDVLSLV